MIANAASAGHPSLDKEETMNGKYLWLPTLLLLASPLQAAEPATEDVWESATIEGAKVGYLHTFVRPVDDQAGKRLRATADLDLTFQRYRSTVRLRMEHGTEETPEGKVVGVFMRQHQERGQQLVLIGTLEDGRMHVRVDNGRIDRKIAWTDDVVGLARRDRFLAEKKPKPGDRFSFPAYEPIVNRVVTVRVAVKEEEFVFQGKRQRLMRVELTPEKLEAQGVSLQLPTTIHWLDKEYMPVRRQIELDGLGPVVLTRTTREAALAKGTGPAPSADIGSRTLIPLNRAIPRAQATRAVVYRITLKGDLDPYTTFAQDDRQEVKKVEGQTFELHVRAVRSPKNDNAQAEAPAEFLGSSHYVNWDDVRVRELARKAVGAETDPWKKARRIERWVKDNVRIDNGAPFVPAGTVARDLRGDCRHFALLTAALCRAEGVPSRVAVGLLYVERDGRKPQMGFHAWTEVWVSGGWLALDATLGNGSIGADHVKVADHSWHGVQSLTPLLPVTRILGKVGIEVVNVEGE
jgi:transglutaminase-like putative cysteine protease